MFQTIRGRLIASYLAIIGILVIVLMGVLLATAASQKARISATSGELGLIGNTVTRNILASQLRNESWEEVTWVINQSAGDTGTRILAVDPQEARILHDSSQEWTGHHVDKRAVPKLFYGTSATGVFSDADNNSWVFYTPPGFQGEDGMIILSKPLPDTFSFFFQRFGDPVLRSALVASVMAVILGWLIARSVATPLQKVVDAVESVGRGDYSRRLPMEGPQEVQTVAQTFNEMTGQVQVAQQAQRDFIANVSHDLQTPLTSIQGWSSAVLDGTIDDEAGKNHAIEVISGEAERMSRMVKQLLELERLESGVATIKREDVNLDEVLRSITESLIQRADSAEITLTLSTTNPPTVTGDKDRLTQLFTNLTDNALTYTPNGGTVGLDLRKNGKSIIVQIKDTGEGIPPDQLGRIFERFYRGDRARKHDGGTPSNGLGLAISKEIVQAHNGEISVNSTVGEGTTFTVHLPLERYQ